MPQPVNKVAQRYRQMIVDAFCRCVTPTVTMKLPFS